MPDPVRVLLDGSVPEKLRLAFSTQLTVETVRYRGWNGLKNGELLRAAEADFDVLVTVDKGLCHQQNVGERDIAVVVLDANGTTYSDLVGLVAEAERACHQSTPGRVVIVKG
ncbi:MAG: hypothetical protein AAGI08_13755 [Bacteroidota bacterium]